MNWNVYVLLFLRRFNLIKMLEVKKVNDHYVILIEVIDDRLMVINDELSKIIMRLREKEWNFYNSSYNAISEAVKARIAFLNYFMIRIQKYMNIARDAMHTQTQL